MKPERTGLAVPEQAIRATWNTMEKPRLNEGFDELYAVRPEKKDEA